MGIVYTCKFVDFTKRVPNHQIRRQKTTNSTQTTHSKNVLRPINVRFSAKPMLAKAMACSDAPPTRTDELAMHANTVHNNAFDYDNA